MMMRIFTLLNQAFIIIYDHDDINLNLNISERCELLAIMKIDASYDRLFCTWLVWLTGDYI